MPKPFAGINARQCQFSGFPELLLFIRYIKKPNRLCGASQMKIQQVFKHTGNLSAYSIFFNARFYMSFKNDVSFQS